MHIRLKQPSFVWGAIGSCYALLGFIAVLWWSWVALAQADFMYSTWYKLLEIRPFIEKMGPVNAYKPGLELCSSSEHQRMFAEITDAIHEPKGKGLSDIRFCNDSGEALLREPEIVHLQDVATLVKVFSVVGYMSTLLWVLLYGILIYKRRLPSPSQVGIMLLSLLVVMTLILLLIGPVEVFYALHVWIFPEEHQWFFYYQESLMTTLMKAPDLFGGIAALWLMLASVGYMALLLALRWQGRS